MDALARMVAMRCRHPCCTSIHNLDSHFFLASSHKSLRADSSQNKTSLKEEVDNTSAKAINKQSKQSQVRAGDQSITKKKRKSSSEKESLKSWNSTDEKANEEVKSKKSRPKLSIEFSTEEG